MIGASGGTASSSDGALEVTIPDGALASSVSITLTPTASPAAGAIGAAYAVGPMGTTFAQPATMTFSYAGAELGGQSLSALRVATYLGGAWQALPGYALSATAQTVSGTTTRVGTFALWAPASSASGACTSIIVGATCGSSSSSGASSSSGGVTCTMPTCATSSSTACAGYPGAAVQSCVEQRGRADGQLLLRRGGANLFRRGRPRRLFGRGEQQQHGEQQRWEQRRSDVHAGYVCGQRRDGLRAVPRRVDERVHRQRERLPGFLLLPLRPARLRAGRRIGRVRQQQQQRREQQQRGHLLRTVADVRGVNPVRLIQRNDGAVVHR